MSKPISQLWHEAASAWVDAEAAASILEEARGSVLAQMMSKYSDMPVSRAEMIVKSSKEWADHIQKMVDARTAANRAKIRMEMFKLKFSEWNNAEANHRVEAKL